MKRSPRACALLAVAALASAGSAAGQEPSAAGSTAEQPAAKQQETPRSRLDADRFSISLGAYSLHPRTRIRLDAPGGRVGTTVDLENDLGIDSRAVARDFDFGVRFGRRHRLELERFAFDRSGSRTNMRQILVGEDTYDIGLRIDTDFDTDITRLGYAYSFARRPDMEVGVHVGVHITEISARIRAAIEPLTSESEEFAETTAPLPVVGVQGAVKFLPRWTLQGRAQIFRLSVDEFEGKMNHATLAIEHDTFRHVGLGLGFDFFEVDLDSTDAGFLGAFNLRFWGPQLFVHTHF